MTPILENLCALDVVFWGSCPDAAGTLHRLTGSVAASDDWMPLETPLPAGTRIEFQPQNGRSSMGASPFFNLQWAQGGVLTAVGWTGRWKAAVSNVDGPIRLKVGLQKLHLALEPGESIRNRSRGIAGRVY